MAIEMSRFSAPGRVDNAGLEFDRFMPAWENDAPKRGETFSAFLDQVSGRSVPDIYTSAYQRWQATTMDTDQMAVWFGKIQGRLFTGLGMPHPLETQVARNRLYGVPMLPGSGLKGLARAWASQYPDLNDDAISVLFGRGGDDEGGDSGYLIFHDAWWIPDSANSPLVKEVVTVHHGEYYASEGEVPATDFDSPNPSFQLAVRGSFMFVIEGAKSWADLAMDILRQGLEEEGFGGKVSAGYGYFAEDEGAHKEFDSRSKAFRDEQQKQQDSQKERQRRSDLSPKKRRLEDIENQVAKLGSAPTQAAKDTLASEVNKLLADGVSWADEHRKEAVSVIKNVYEATGWHKPGANSKQKKRQRAKKEAALDLLEKGEKE